jgi:hypothetical protein
MVTSQIRVAVYSEDGTTLRGELFSLANAGPATELTSAAALRNKTYADGDVTSAFAIFENDRLVVEIGYTDAAGTTPEGQASYGAPIGNDDLLINETTTTATFCPWIEFSPPFNLKGAPVAANEQLEQGYLAEETGPFATNESPIGIEPCVTETSVVSVRIGTVLPRTLDLTTLEITLQEGFAAPVVAITGGAYQAGYSGSIIDVSTALEDLRDVTVSPDALFAFGVIGTATVAVDDDLGTSLSPPVSWAFSICPETPSVPVAVIDPVIDTLRGGAEIIVSSESLLLDTSRDELFTGLALPSAWTAAVAGSGQVRFTRDGVLCDSRLTSASTAGLTSTDSYLNADMALDVVFKFPEDVATPVDLAVLEVTSVSGATARVRLRRGVGVNPALIAVFGDLTLASGQTVVGGIEIVDPRPHLTLRIVRNGARVFGFFGRRVDGRYTELHEILAFDRFATDTGVVRFRVGNLGYAGRVETLFRNFTVRSHMTIDGKLIDNKLDLGAHRLFGNVPATSLARLGLRDVVVFGLFGSVTDVDGFEYILPPPKTVGRNSEFLRLYQDVQLRDGED